MKGVFGTNPVTHRGPFQVFSFCLPWFISSSVLFTAACGMCSFMFVNAEFYLLHSSLISEETQFLFFVHSLCVISECSLSTVFHLSQSFT